MVSPSHSNPEELGCGGALLWWGGGEVGVGEEEQGGLMRNNRILHRMHSDPCFVASLLAYIDWIFIQVINVFNYLQYYRTERYL